MGMINKYCPRANAAVNTLYRGLRLYCANRSWRAWRQLLSYSLRTALGRPVPHFTTIGLTYRCQCSCDHCYVNASEKDKSAELSTGEVKSVIDQLRQLGVLEVIFSGGEPLLRKDILELVGHAHDSGLLTRVNTNGLLLSREMVSGLKKAGVSQCAVSMDDVDPQTHDISRRLPGLHKKALEGIANLRALSVSCQIVTLASKRTITAGLEKVVALGRQLGIMCVYICFPVAIGSWEGAAQQVLTEEEMARVRALQDTTFVHLELPTARILCSVCARNILSRIPQIALFSVTMKL